MIRLWSSNYSAIDQTIAVGEIFKAKLIIGKSETIFRLFCALFLDIISALLKDFFFSRMSSSTEWLVCGLCGAKVNCGKSLNHFLKCNLLDRSGSCLIIQITENFWRDCWCRTWRIFQQSMSLKITFRFSPSSPKFNSFCLQIVSGVYSQDSDCQWVPGVCV